MKKNYLKIAILFLAMAFILALTGNVNAATEPKLETFNGKEYFFANGTPITIQNRLDGIEGAKIVWAGGEKDVASNANVFGGMHDDATSVDTSITMNGGTVKNIFGGGLHSSNTNNAKIVINGGKVKGVQGGGASSLTHNCSCANSATWYAGEATSSPCQTNKTEVVINGGSGFVTVYGGGEGISNTKNASLTINGGDLSGAWVTAGGSNGNTTNVDLKIAGGKINTVQTVNRGTISNANVEVYGNPSIKKMYVGGETEDSSVTGTITGNVNVKALEHRGIPLIEKLYLGKNGGNPIDLENGNIKAENIKVSSSCVGNINDIENLIVPMYSVVFEYILEDLEDGSAGGFGIYIEKGKTLKTVEELERQLEGIDGQKFVKIMNGEEEFDLDTPIMSDMNLMAIYGKIEENKEEVKDNQEENEEGTKDNQEEKSEKDETPKTGAFDIALYVLTALGTIALVSAVKAKTSKH